MLIIWICRITGNLSRYCRYEGVVFEEAMLVKERGFIDDSKKGFLLFLHECL